MKNKIDNSIKKYNDLKKTSRGKAIIKLTRYLVFVFFLIIVFIISGTGKPNNKASQNIEQESFESKIDITYKDKQEILYTNNYDFKYTVTGAINVKYPLSLTGDIIIPTEIDGITVSAIDHSAFKSCPIESVNIPDTVSLIGRWAFSYCKYLKSIDTSSVRC